MNVTALAYYADDVVYGLLFAVFFPFQEGVEQGAGVEVELISGAGIDRSHHLDHVFVDGMDHQGMQIGARQCQEEFCILVKEQEGMPDVLRIVKSVDADGAAAVLQIELDDLVEIIIEGVRLGREIVVERHAGYACFLYDIRYRDIIIILPLHQADHGFADALSGKSVSLGKFVPEDILHQWKIPFHDSSPYQIILQILLFCKLYHKRAYYTMKCSNKNHVKKP